MMRLSAFAIVTLMWVTYFDVEAQVDTGAGYIYKLPVTQVLHYLFFNFTIISECCISETNTYLSI